MSGMPTAPYQDFAKEKLGFEFQDIQLLMTALTHRSYVNEHKKSARRLRLFACQKFNASLN